MFQLIKRHSNKTHTPIIVNICNNLIFDEQKAAKHELETYAYKPWILVTTVEQTTKYFPKLKTAAEKLPQNQKLTVTFINEGRFLWINSTPVDFD